MSRANPRAVRRDAPDNVQETNDLGAALRWIGIAGILIIAILRCVLVNVSQTVFDVDPAFDQSQPGGFGPGGSLMLDALLAMCAAMTAAGEWASGRAVDWKLWLLAFAGVPVVLWHGMHDSGDLWRGSTWAAAMLAAAALAHAGRDRSTRIIVIAILGSLAAIVLARGFAQVTYEYKGMVELFEKDKAHFLAQRGWLEDSSAARIFERRLRQPQPIAWCETSNIFASLAGSAMVLWIGLAIAGGRAKLAAGWWTALAACAAGAAGMVWLTGSKGAAGAIVVAVAMMLALMHSAWLVRVPRRAGWLMLGAVAMVLLAVVVRGVILPEGFASEKSLLFRWHYMVASAAMVGQHFGMGVGPDGYQAAYILHRVPRSPEEVISAHSMFIDWLATLGVCSVMWIALALALLWRAGAHVMSVEGGESIGRSKSYQESMYSRMVVVAGGVIVAAAGAGLAVEWPALDVLSIRVRVFGAAAAVVVAAIMIQILQRGSSKAIAAAVAGAVAVLAMHGQIEMTFQQPGSVVWAMCMLGVAGANVRVLGGHRWIGMVVAVGCVAFAAAVMGVGAVPALRQERMMRDAAALLSPIALKPDDAGVVLTQRRLAAEALVKAFDAWPASVQPLDAAARQLELASSTREGPQPVGLLQEGLDIASLAVREHGKPSSMVTAIELSARLGQITGDGEYWNTAITLAQQVAAGDPHGIGAWRRLGDVLWLADRRPEAADAYRHALESDLQFALDPLKQLSDQDRQTIRDRIEAK